MLPAPTPERRHDHLTPPVRWRWPRRKWRALAVALLLALVWLPGSADANGNRKARASKSGKVTSARLSPQLQRAADGFRARNPKLGSKIDTWKKRYLKKVEKRGLNDDGSAVKGKQRRKEDAKLRKRVARLNQHISRTPAKDARKTLIVVDGADGAGKSSTIDWIAPAFAGARTVKTDRIGASPDGRTAIERVETLLDELPAGGVLILDRYAGDAVFDADGRPRTSDAETDAQLKAYNAFESRIAPNVEIVKFHLDVSADRQTKTFGKREALNPDKLSVRDYEALEVRDQHRSRFRYVTKRSDIKWKRVDMDDRVDGRTSIIKHLEKRFGARD